jgi:hypothetical protein
MKKIAVLASLTILSGCAGTAAPTFFAGNYYLAGDSDCRRFQASTDARIECFNSKGNFRGYRYAMNSEALRIWQAERAYNDAQIEGLTQSLKQVGQTFEQGGQRILQQSQGYSVPQAQSYQQPAGVTYRRVGDAIIDSYGRTYRQVGQTLISSDGTTCSIVGENIFCGGR